MNQQGLPNFGALQNAFDSASAVDNFYCVFDLPYFDGLDLRQLGVASRRNLLCSALTRNQQDSIRFSEAFEQAPQDQDLLASISRLGLEGVMSKRTDLVYVSGRSSSWIKLKSGMRHEFVIGGYTGTTGLGTRFGALMLGLHDAEGTLR